MHKSLWCGLCYALLFKNDRHYIHRCIQTLHHYQSHHMGLHQIRTSHACALPPPDSLCFRYFPTTAWPFPSIHPLKTTPLRSEPYPIQLVIVVSKYQNSDFAPLTVHCFSHPPPSFLSKLLSSPLFLLIFFFFYRSTSITDESLTKQKLAKL